MSNKSKVQLICIFGERKPKNNQTDKKSKGECKDQLQGFRKKSETAKHQCVSTAILSSIGGQDS